MKKIKLSQLFSKNNYFYPNWWEKLKDKINNYSYSKLSFKRYFNYSWFLIPVFLVFFFWLAIFLNIEDHKEKASEPKMMMQDNDDFKKDTNTKTEDNDFWTMSLENNIKDESSDSWIMSTENLNKESFTKKTINLDSNKIFKDWRRALFFSLILLNFSLLYFILRFFDIYSNYFKFLLVLAFILDIFLFYYIIFILL